MKEENFSYMARVNANPDRFNKMEYTRLLKKAKGDSRSQRSFAMEAGISVPHMCKMLNGVFDVPPTQTTLRKIATVAVGGVTYAQLMKVCGYDVASEEKEFYPSIYMTPSQPKKITEPLREFRSLPEGTHAELYDYQLHYLKTPSVSQVRLCRDIYHDINNYISRTRKNYEIFESPFHVFLNEDDAKCLIPSICVVSDQKSIQQDGYYGAPDLVIDVIGHGNEEEVYGSKLFKYRENGVGEYIIVDQLRKVVFDYDFRRKKTHVFHMPCAVPVQLFNGVFNIRIH